MQLYSEGVQYELKGMMDKAIDRYIAARLRADGEIKDLIQGKLDHIAILQIEKAELLSSQGKVEQAIKLMENIAHFSKEARDKIPYFEARQLMQKAEKALKFGFYSKSLDLLDQAFLEDKSLNFEVSTLRYQVATHLVEMANKVSDHAELRSAIQMLVDASTMTGGLGEKNEKILDELLNKFKSDQEREMSGRIDQRMDDVRQRAITKKIIPPLTIGMTVPDIQSLLGHPKNIVEKKDSNGTSIQLWIYPLEGGGDMYLSFKDYILFKIKKDA
jgi:tetratricopeptide (TPR) repeat protein